MLLETGKITSHETATGIADTARLIRVAGFVTSTAGGQARTLRVVTPQFRRETGRKCRCYTHRAHLRSAT